MYKNFLTHQLAQSFDGCCAISQFEPASAHAELQRCSRNMLYHLQIALMEKDMKDVAKHLYVAITYLRDCREILDAARVNPFDLIGRWEVVHARLEQMCLEAADFENGQLRMLG